MERDSFVVCSEVRTKFERMNFNKKCQRGGNNETIKFLIAKGAQPAVPDYSGIFPVEFSARWGNKEAVQMLCEKNNANKARALIIAAKWNRKEIVEWIEV